MVFSSHLFLFWFLPAALLLYYATPRRGRHLLLTLSSYLFYGWANPAFVLILLFSTLIDYVCGLTIAGAWHTRGPIAALSPQTPRTRRQRTALIFSVVTNLSLLGFFKYFNFAIDNANALAAALGFTGLDTVLRITLPLGISFYTFQSMSYTIDVYRGHAAALRNGVDFACYVSMFPQLVAGPIVRFSEVAGQFASHPCDLVKTARGVAFLALGLAKKVLLANPCGKIADTVFDAAAVTTLDAWLGSVAYSFQIYFDFSGYSDMAVGLGLLLGFVLPKNFDAPYRSRSITEFWQRWHLSLSSWLRDYLYIPLGGNRKGPGRTQVNLALVMLLGGLWHGASWNFVVWGGLHGAWLIAERAMGRRSPYAAMPAAIRTGVTFLLVTTAWVFFRAADLPAAVRMLATMAGAGPGLETAHLVSGVLHKPYYLLSLGMAAGLTWLGPQAWDWSRSLGPVKIALVLLLFVLTVVILETQAYNPFIYFIF